LADEGKFRPLVDDTRFTLATVAETYRRLQSRDATGKVVIDIARTAS
jgi:NADPH:quinone reductase-like Zn-dependent oxidoreductase